MKQFWLGQLAAVTAILVLVFRPIALLGTAVAQDGTAVNFGTAPHGKKKSIDPGPRGGAPGAGGPLVGLDDATTDLLEHGVARAGQVTEGRVRVGVLGLEVRTDPRIVAVSQPVPVVDAEVGTVTQRRRSPRCAWCVRQPRHPGRSLARRRFRPGIAQGRRYARP